MSAQSLVGGSSGMARRPLQSASRAGRSRPLQDVARVESIINGRRPEGSTGNAPDWRFGRVRGSDSLGRNFAPWGIGQSNAR